MTTEEAIENAARLLFLAENDPETARMERYEKIADSWISLAHLVNERDRV